MQVTLGAEVVATLAAPSVLPAANMGARIETPVTRVIVSYYRRASYDAATRTWTVRLESPVAAGDYNLVWRTDDPSTDGVPSSQPPEMEVFVPLTVTR